MSLPTNAEQEMLELINRSRANPAGEFGHLIQSLSPPAGVTPEITSAITFFSVDLALLRQQLQAYAPVAPLAWNTTLEDAAAAHSALMIQADSQSHQLPGEADLGTRVRNAGYAFASVGENIYAYASSVLYGHAGFMIDWGIGPGGMQTPAGHRQNLLNATMTEIGIDITAEANPATQVGPLLITEDLGTRFGYAAQIMGVVYDDTSNDAFYTAGEGEAGVTVTASGTAGVFSTTTWSSGGYQIAAPRGTYTLTFSGGALRTARSVQATLDTANVKVDAQDAAPVFSIAAANARRAEGDAGGAHFTFTVTRAGAAIAASVAWSVAGTGGGTGADAADFAGGVLPSGTLSFAAGESSKTLLIDSAGDLAVEADEGFVVTLSSPSTGAAIGTASASGVILNDDGPAGSVSLPPNSDFTVSAPNQTVRTGGGVSHVTLNSARSLVIGSSGADFILDGGGADTINLGTGATTIAATTGGPMVFGGPSSGALFFSGGAGEATVYAGAGATTVFANAGGGQFFAGEAPSLLFVGGAGASTVVGGTGRSTLFGGASGRDLLVAGSGLSTVVGAGAGAVIVGRGAAGGVLIAGSGAETLVGSADGGNDMMFAGSGPNVLYAGTGNDTFVAAHGDAQMIAGRGRDLFLFSNGAAGGAVTIWNFAQGQDHLALFGYGTNAVSGALASAVKDTSTIYTTMTITLPDNTRITFGNFAAPWAGPLRTSDFL